MTAHTPPRNLILSIALLQGLMLFGLYKTFDLNVWPSDSPAWFMPLWAIAVLTPVVVQLSLTQANAVILARGVLVLMTILALTGVYTGWQMLAESVGRSSAIVATFCISTTVAVFKALIYGQRWMLAQQSGQSEPGSGYALLFLLSWRNFLTGVLAGLFVVGVGLVLALWAGLFSVIGIEFFSELFTKDWFLFPVLSVAFGLGVLIFRTLDQVIDSITRLLEGLFRLLLPLVVLLAVVFVATLPFVGLQPLWDTGNGTALLMILLGGLLFSLNAVYQDGSASVYPSTIQWGMCVGVVLLPVIASLAGYGLWLRLAQYGLTVERCWALFVWVFLAAFSLGYVWSILRHRLRWVQTLGFVNTRLGMVLGVALVLVNTPLLDFRKLSLSSQVGRVESGAITWAEFDACYVHQNLGAPGERLLQAQLEAGNLDASTFEGTFCHRGAMPPAQVWDRIKVYPAGVEVPEALREKIVASISLTPDIRYALLQVQIREASEHPDFVLLEVHDNYSYARYFTLRPRSGLVRLRPSSACPSGRSTILPG